MEDAKRLVKLLKGMLCHVNLIPINKIENGEYTKSSNENIIKFRDYLNDHGIVATIRRELGSDIDAACGQLRRKNLNTPTKNMVGVKDYSIKVLFIAAVIHSLPSAISIAFTGITGEPICSSIIS